MGVDALGALHAGRRGPHVARAEGGKALDALQLGPPALGQPFPAQRGHCAVASLDEERPGQIERERLVGHAQLQRAAQLLLRAGAVAEAEMGAAQEQARPRLVGTLGQERLELDDRPPQVLLAEGSLGGGEPLGRIGRGTGTVAGAERGAERGAGEDDGGAGGIHGDSGAPRRSASARAAGRSSYSAPGASALLRALRAPAVSPLRASASARWYWISGVSGL